jgi:nondiscriminating glutamyl-tRNA synthetase
MEAEKLKLVKPQQIRVRIAPSPTGPFHVGTARTALLNYLFAKNQKGSFILRIEDTDQERSQKKWEEDIINNMRWLGITWDEGPNIGGDYGPYRQSQRKEFYRKYIQELLDDNCAYHCFCTMEELEAQKQYQASIGEYPHYSGECSHLEAQEVKKRLANKESSVIRLRVPIKEIIFRDLIRGEIRFDSRYFGDFIIAKDLDHPLYNFAVVIDDFMMKISHIIRGTDHISNTPKQILIQEAFQFPRIKYAHLPLVLGPDRQKLSKREAVVAISDYKKDGYLPQAIVNFSVLLGWNAGEDREMYSMPEIIEKFSLEKVQKAGAIFDIQRLNWMNGFYIRQEALTSLTYLCIPFLIKDGLIEPTKKKLNQEKKGTNGQNYLIKTTQEEISISRLESIVSLYHERLKKLSEISELIDFFFKEIDFERELLMWKEQTEKDVKNSLKCSRRILTKIRSDLWQEDKIRDVLLEELKSWDDKGELLWPLRIALTGKKNSAGPFEIAAVLGKQKTLERLTLAIKKI